MTTQLESMGTVEFVIGLRRGPNATANRYSTCRPAHASLRSMLSGRIQNVATVLSAAFDRTGAMIRRCVASVREEIRVRKAIDQLEALDDHLLKDIGVKRCGIKYVVRVPIDARWP